MSLAASILTTKDAADWNRFLERIPGGAEPFFRPAFYTASEQKSRGTAECFVYEDGGETAVYPYLRRKLNQLSFLSDSNWCDIAGGYGYNGATATSLDPEFSRKFRASFQQHCADTKILTEFSRFHPLLRNRELFASDCEIVVQNKNVALDLRRPLEDIRAEYEHSCRKNIKKARRSGATVVIENGAGPRFAEFLRIYVETMRRVGATADYLFDRAYFEDLAGQLKPEPVFFYVERGNLVVSCELVLRSNRIVYSYLGGTDSDAFENRPNNLLKDAIVGWAHSAGCEWYLLGGGKAPDDGIFRYKKTFAPLGTLDFEIGLRIFDSTAYEEVIGRWEKNSLHASPENKRLQRYWE